MSADWDIKKRACGFLTEGVRGASSVDASDQFTTPGLLFGCSHLQASSYSCALQGEPFCSLANFARHQAVSGELPLEGYIRVRGLEKGYKPLDTRSRHDRIHASGGNEHCGATEIPLLSGLVNEHRPQQNRSLQYSRLYQHHG